MPLRRRWGTVKPPHHTQPRVDWTSPLADRLVYCTLANTPGFARDLVRGVVLPFVSGTTLGVSPSGVGLLNDSTTDGIKTTAPDHLKPTEATLIWRGVVLGAGSANAPMAFVTHNNTNTAPFTAFGFDRNAGTTDIRAQHDVGGSFQLLTAGAGTLTYLKTHEIALSVKGGAQALYVDGILVASGAVSGAIAYSATSQLTIGTYPTTSRNGNMITDGLWIYAKAMTEEDVREHHRSPYSMLVTPAPRARKTIIVPAGEPRQVRGLFDRSFGKGLFDTAWGKGLFDPEFGRGESAPTVGVAFISSTAVLNAPTVAAEPLVTGATIASGSTTFAPTIRYRVLAATLATAATLFAPVVRPVVQAPHISSGAALHAPSALPGAVSVTGAHKASSATLSAPTVSPGAIAVTGATLASTATLTAPTITTGGSNVAGAHRASTAVVTSPTVTTGPVSVTGTHIASTVQLRAATVSPGAVVISGAFISSGTALSPPTVSIGFSVIGATITTTVTLTAPSVTAGAVSITSAAIGSTAVLTPPSITIATPGDQVVTANAYFRLSVTTEPADFARTKTLEPGGFARTVTTEAADFARTKTMEPGSVRRTVTTSDGER